MYDLRQWAFVTDMNYSGSVTISDIWLWFKWLYFYPGDGFIYFLVNKFPALGRFLEITYSNYGGVLSGITSFFVWIIVALIIVGIIEKAETEQKKSDLIAAQLTEFKRAQKNIEMFKQEMRNAGVTEEEIDYEVECLRRYSQGIFERMKNHRIKERVQEYLKTRTPESVDSIVKDINKDDYEYADDYEYGCAKKNIVIYKNELKKVGIAGDELLWLLDDCWKRFTFFAKLENPEEYAKKKAHDYLENRKKEENNIIFGKTIRKQIKKSL